MGLGLVFDIFDLEGVGIPLGLGPIPVAVWAVDEGEIGLLIDLGMWDYPSCMGDLYYIIIHACFPGDGGRRSCWRWQSGFWSQILQ